MAAVFEFRVRGFGLKPLRFKVGSRIMTVVASSSEFPNNSKP